MSYADFTASRSAPEAVRSPLESLAFGADVFRLLYPRGGLPSAEEIEAELLRTDADLMILRFPAEAVAVAGEIALRVPDRLVIDADTLVYFSSTAATRTSPQAHDADPVREIGAMDPRLAECIRLTFAGYANHYAADPFTAAVSIEAAYADWATVHESSRVVLGIDGDDGALLACAVLEDLGEVTEVVLAGVVPSARNRGVYRALMEGVEKDARRRNQSWVISTQAWNTSPQRTWTRLGLEPQFALKTLHVVKRSLL